MALRLFACAAVILSSLALAVANSPARPPGDLPVATDARLEVQGENVRLTMALSRPVSANATVLAGPDRVIVELPSVNFQVDAKQGRKSAGFVSGFRYGLFMADRARIILDLAQPAAVASVTVKPVRGGFGELVVELKRVSREEFAALARETAAKTQLPSIPVERKAEGDSRRIVVIDPGHGGIDPGTQVAAIAEKAVVLAFGLKLKEQLEAQGRYRVIMTRSDDTFISLNDRVRIARGVEANLFISIHADSLAQAQDVRGATIYTGSERASDAEAARLAAKENQADAVAGLDSSEDVQDVAGILMDLAKRETRSFSTIFARNLVERLGGSVKMHKVPLRSAGFRVLTAPDVPSVLIELGYMSSPKDAELLNSEGWRTQASAAVQQAVDQYFERLQSPGKAAQSRP
ncbi:MAG: N-acetylmuramoyl-L-alanine amidase [Bosea sp.]|uniref:N-acetylmuramoyl-L-alanine amidase n=1 Tax=Bosea sp. (in: a-proteobacteria) TaxID=1871050 RepID=UPI002384FA1A|nr:N-acetylmuramoyl-L-alanine amidase [Bosea sp. (in: a-proteobacteria)]MCP4739437.1 N-acetylmuramoyl-L-alanine amidase [Bosea sp. (in: a-proteobacteria)]